jgi:hypothetical protein
MDTINDKQVEEAFYKAVTYAIETMGLEEFKKTSFFGSNVVAAERGEFPLAA